MKTPEEIKKGLECCSLEAMFCSPEDPKCSYDCGDEQCIRNLMRDALVLIQQLEAERDAAVKDCGCFPCQTCEERENGDLCPMCEIEGGYRSFYQWRGV